MNTPKEFIESEIQRFEKISLESGQIKVKDWETQKKIIEIETSNQEMVNNFKWDRGHFFPWFKETYPRFKDEDLIGKSPYYWMSNNGTSDERQILWKKAQEIQREGTEDYYKKLNDLRKKRDLVLKAVGDFIYDDPEYEGITADEKIDLILSYLRSIK